MTIRFAIRGLAVLAAVTTLAACASYPDAPRYAIHAGEAPPPSRGPARPAVPIPTGEGVRGPTDPDREVPPPMTAPVAEIEGGALASPVIPRPRNAPAAKPAAGPASEGFDSPPPPPRAGAAVAPGAAYEIQPGDTISGVGRRFQTPVQTLIDLNSIALRGGISPRDINSPRPSAV